MMTWTANEVYVHPNPEKVNLISDCPKCYSGNWAVCARNNSGKYQITCNRDSCRHEYKVTLEARKHPF